MDTNKANGGGIGAGGGGGIGGSVAVLIVALWWPHADAASVAALTTICSTISAIGGAWLGAYMVPHTAGG